MKRIITTIAAFLLVATMWAQSPEKMSYQAVIRDASNNLIVNQSVGMQISILQGGPSGVEVYVETQMINSNTNGLVSLEIGSGNVVSGNFSTIDWANDTYFIKTETDPTGGTNYSITGVTQMMSVPYAMHSKTADNVFSGDYNDLANSPTIPTNTSDLTNNSGFITNADDADADPNNEIQNLSLSGTTLSIGGGNNVDLISIDTKLTEGQVDNFVSNNGYLTSFTEVDGSISNELQTLSLSGTTLSITNGNNVNLNSLIPSSPDEIVDADNDTKVQVERTSDNDKIDFISEGNTVLKISNRNIEFPYHNKSIFLGFESGLSDNLNGNHYNTYLGYRAGKANITSQFNTAVGGYALTANTGSHNIAFGYSALYENISGSGNNAIGVYSLNNNTDGDGNTAIGNAALRTNTTGSENVAVGNSALYMNNGYRNTVIGYKAGRQNATSSSDNVFIGYKAGYYESGSNKLVIGNDWNGVGSKLIYGDFTTGKVTIERVLRLPPSTTPASPENGDIYLNSSNGHIYCYIYGVWKQLDN